MPSSDIISYAQDDMSMRLRPSYYVDYFSHDWSYETIQRSWRYIVSNTNEFNNAARLENASLRICMKLLNKLKTIPPEALNWFKDYDVTWLYGPLQTSGGPSSSYDKSNSSASDKKPSLKRRSIVETMFQKSCCSRPVGRMIRNNGMLQVAMNQRAASIQFRLSPSSSLRLLSSIGEGKHVRFSEEVTVYAY
ncbi:hypothetical protein N5P37_011280 [Trichoderma harzianum]|nr:hypothetical protein N5P37_011280 [Trichoderma harzianum]